ncbi:MAG: T9SS type A sorting domain-containing protein, partial [Flavobacteriales bacterium]|nr:T9SS type A sorting domain-containing protein [Flavobacteriales bacterium]
DGTYNVCLIVNSGCGTDILCSPVTVTSCAQVIAAFNYSDTALSVYFNDLSVNAGSWSWDFDDGFSSVSQYPTHIYAVPGLYTVCLTAYSACTSDTTCMDITVAVTGIDEQTFGSFMDVYPNPTDGLLNISIHSEVLNDLSVSIYNLLGERIFHVEGSELHLVSANSEKTTFSLNLDDLASGTYFLKVQSDDKFFMEQIIFSK